MMMKTDWVIVAEACQARQVDMDLIIRPEKYRDQASAAKRAGVLRDAYQQGVAIPSLTTICPMTERGIRKQIGIELALKRQNPKDSVPN